MLGIIYRYDCIKRMSPAERQNVVPRICVIGGKAAPGYEMAKRIIKLVSAVADKVGMAGRWVGGEGRGSVAVHSLLAGGVRQERPGKGWSGRFTKHAPHSLSFCGPW